MTLLLLQYLYSFRKFDRSRWSETNICRCWRRLNINPDLIEKAITKKLKRSCQFIDWKTLLYGQNLKIAKKHKLIVIEDAAQGMGAYFKKKHTGMFGKISAFSAHPLKNLNALGDGGFVITSDKKFYDKINYTVIMD